MADMMPKVKTIREECERRGLHDMYIEVDGGIDTNTISVAAEAGANAFVSGSAIFKAPDAKVIISELKEKASV